MKRWLHASWLLSIGVLRTAANEVELVCTVLPVIVLYLTLK